MLFALSFAPMPEGPSIVILKQEVRQFKKKKILEVSGNTKKFDLDIRRGKTITAFKSWGKHFLICFNKFTIRIHFLLFGSYKINHSKDTSPRLHMKFADGELNFYACAMQIIRPAVK